MPANRRAGTMLFFAVIAIAAAAIVYAVYQNRPWTIPAEAKRRTNPIQSSPPVLTAARATYNEKCANCHGDTGKGDGPDARSYYPRPASLADALRMDHISDGELFYKISEGRKPMPAFKKRLTEEQRWSLVLFLRTFAQENSPAH